MIIIVRMTIAGGKKIHAVRYNTQTGQVTFFCNSFKFETYLAHVADPTPATAQNVTCKKCLQNIKEWGVHHNGEQ